MVIYGKKKIIFLNCSTLWSAKNNYNIQLVHIRTKFGLNKSL